MSIAIEIATLSAIGRARAKLNSQLANALAALNDLDGDGKTTPLPTPELRLAFENEVETYKVNSSAAVLIYAKDDRTEETRKTGGTTTRNVLERFTMGAYIKVIPSPAEETDQLPFTGGETLTSTEALAYRAHIYAGAVQKVAQEFFADGDSILDLEIDLSEYGLSTPGVVTKHGFARLEWSVLQEVIYPQNLFSE